MYAVFWLVALLLKSQGLCSVSGDHVLDDSPPSFILRRYIEHRALIRKMASKSEPYDPPSVLFEEHVTDYETHSTDYVYEDSSFMSKLRSSGKPLALTYRMYPESESFEPPIVLLKAYTTGYRKQRGIRNENEQKLVDEQRQEKEASSSDTVSDDSSDTSKSNRYKKPLGLADRLCPESEAVERANVPPKYHATIRGNRNENKRKLNDEERQDSSDHVHDDSSDTPKSSGDEKPLALADRLCPESESIERSDVQTKAQVTGSQKQRRHIPNKNKQEFIDQERQVSEAGSSNHVSDDSSGATKLTPLALVDRLSPESEVVERANVPPKYHATIRGNRNENKRKLNDEERQDSSDHVHDDSSDTPKSSGDEKPLALADRLCPESEVVERAEASTKAGSPKQRRSIQNENEKELIDEERQDHVIGSTDSIYDESSPMFQLGAYTKLLALGRRNSQISEFVETYIFSPKPYMGGWQKRNEKELTDEKYQVERLNQFCDMSGDCVICIIPAGENCCRGFEYDSKSKKCWKLE